MARLVEGVGPLFGGALASRLHGHSMHGDPAISSMVQRIMNSVCSPLYSMINRWVLHGELLDPNKEVHCLFVLFLSLKFKYSSLHCMYVCMYICMYVCMYCG